MENIFIVRLFLVLVAVLFFIGIFYPILIKGKLVEGLFGHSRSDCEFCCKALTSVLDPHKCIHNCVWGIACDCCKVNRGQND